MKNARLVAAMAFISLEATATEEELAAGIERIVGENASMKNELLEVKKSTAKNLVDMAIAAKKITEANDAPLKGMENDRVPRKESYIKDFKPMDLGMMVLKKGKGTLTLKTLEVAGWQVADVRLLLFRRVD